jgi:hypothetical protein
MHNGDELCFWIGLKWSAVAALQPSPQSARRLVFQKNISLLALS